MQIGWAQLARNRTGSNTSKWLALTFALLIHAIILSVPIVRQLAPGIEPDRRIEVQLLKDQTQTTTPQTAVTVPTPLPQPVPAPPRVEPPKPVTRIAEKPAEPPPHILPAPLQRQRDFEQLGAEEKNRLTNVILSRQFITEKSVTEQLFGTPLEQHHSEWQKEFHIPQRQNLVTMLNRPMQDLPFAYTPGLVHFAYAPGVKGDLQRFWDVITPEFGWKTKNGTEFRCVWLLVVAGCGWK